MATVEPVTRPHDQQSRRRPFSAWMKRLANLKNSSSSHGATGKKATSPSKQKKDNVKNNPYPQLRPARHSPAASSANGHLSFSTPAQDNQSNSSSISLEDGEQEAPERRTFDARSAAPTVATNAETLHSEAGQSKAGTSNTVGGGMSSMDYSGNSTFSSPNHSTQSLTTTLTTIQSTAPSAMLGPGTAQGTAMSPLHASNAPNLQAPQFSHQYPISPASALPAHLTPQNHPSTYRSATANNILTDDASVMTLASSSKRRRRHSLDTNASVRAIAPSSVWGGSRESLPLSVLSGNVDLAPPPSAGGMYASSHRLSAAAGGLASAERASVYSSSGVTAPLMTSDRSSYYTKRAEGGDSGSVRSGIGIGHGRSDSAGGAASLIGREPTSPLASPKEPLTPGTFEERDEVRDEDK